MSSEDSVPADSGAVSAKSVSKKWRDAIRPLPLVGPLADCRVRDHVETVREVSVTLVLATMPFWLGALVLYGTEKSHLDFRAAFYSTIWEGGLFMTATGLLAPLFWITADDPQGARAFPSRLAHVLLTVVLSAVASVFFGLGIVNKELREPFTFHLSVVIFFAAASLLYLGTVYHLRRLPNSAEAFRESETDFVAAYERHRG